MKFRFSLFFLLACGSAEGATPVAERQAPEVIAARAVRVETAVLATSRSNLAVNLPGEVVGSRDALLGTATGGLVEAVLVEAGDEVRQGATLVRVDAAAMSAQLAQTRVEVDAATRELARAERMADSIPRQQLDMARTRLQAAEAAARTAEVMISRAVVRAPFPGTVASVSVERGEIAPPGAPLVRLVQMNPIEVRLSVPDRDVVSLRPGMAARVRVGAAGATRTGVVHEVEPAADLQTRTFTVKVRLDNEDRGLLPGMIASVEIDTADAVERLLVPAYVLVTKLNESGIFVIDSEGKARFRTVTLGAILRDQVVIESGIAAGDRIIVGGHRELADGDALVVAREGRCCDEGRIVFSDEPQAPSSNEEQP